jgi:hypothetical protein
MDCEEISYAEPLQWVFVENLPEFTHNLLQNAAN